MGCSQRRLGCVSAEGSIGGGSGYGPGGKLRTPERSGRVPGMWRDQEGLKREARKIVVPC